ncbi:hypothetical protein ACFS5M_05395 [Lacinutrix iliipiscaria]|uniref:Uncharacterized protein n=1 Tax=Lacinutrix iliipiscaria TaxID=1230532 RepID=A0ABW5WK61_9FLAO
MKKIKLILVLLAISLTSVSCLVDDEVDTDFSNSPYIVGFASSSTLESHFVDVGPINVDIPVNVLGGNSGLLLSNDLTVNYVVDPSSTATEGNEFTLTGSSFNIAANTEFGILPIQVNTGGLDPDTPTTLVLKLTTASEGGTVSSPNSTYTITFVGCQSDHAGVYSCPDLPSGAAGQATITELAPNTYRISALPGIGFGGTDPVWFDFTNVCGEINVSGWQLGSLATSTGSVSESGAITFDGIILYNGGDPSTGVWFDLGATTYTPL